MTSPSPAAGPFRGLSAHPAGKWVGLVAVALTVGATALLLGSGLGHDPNRLPATLVGHAAPDFNLQTIDSSRQVQLSSLRGQTVLVNFWASWCQACKLEEPVLSDTWSRYQDRGVVVLGISFQDSAVDTRAYAASRHISWPLLADPGSRTALAYGVTGLPETYFIGADGRVLHKETGPVNSQLIAAKVKVLQRRSAP